MRVFIILALIFLSGCAGMTRGGDQNIMVRTSGNIDRLGTQCKLTGNGQEISILAPAVVTVDRSGRDLKIECENDSQKGVVVAKSSTNGGLVGLNVLMDFCTISCIIDFSTGAIYDYQEKVTVPMR